MTTREYLRTLTIKEKLKWFFHTYKHAWLFLYGIVYMVWFRLLEKRNDAAIYVVHTSLDDMIPFNEWFVIPYLMWFFYIAWILIYTCLTSRSDFFKVFAAMFGGMTICLVIYTVWPNGQDLRPVVMPRHNILTAIVAWIYSIDSPTNVCPSIHVFNSVIAFMAVMKNEHFKYPVKVRTISLVLTVLICLSTMFMKQHSTFDVGCGLLLSFIMYLMVYVPDYSRLFVEESRPEEKEV